MVKLTAIDIDAVPLGFGKYKGQTPNDIGNADPGYIVWLYENLESKVCSKELYKACEMDRESTVDDSMKPAFDDEWSVR